MKINGPFYFSSLVKVSRLLFCMNACYFARHKLNVLVKWGKIWKMVPDNFHEAVAKPKISILNMSYNA